jgi:molybdate transport system ATP-binding protein
MIKAAFRIKRNDFELTFEETFDDGITGIYGPSGAGKTSILNAIAGLVVPAEGKIQINNIPVFDTNEGINVPVHKRSLGYVFQSGRLFPHMTVEKNLRYGVNKKRSQLVCFKEVVTILKIDHVLKSMPSSISGGEYQRVAIGRALLSSPDILLLDEPFSAVDTALRSQIIPYLLTIHRKINLPMLVVSHELTDLLKLTNKLCIVKEGKCVGHDDYQNLLQSKSIAQIFSSFSILNAIVLNVESCDTAKGISILKTDDNKNSVRIICEKSKQQYTAGQKLKIFINSQDIALSSQKLTGITIQNQLQGTIVAIFDNGATTCCIVDAGFKLVVEITAESHNRLDINIGSNVWCLFKSVAIDVAG